MTEMLYWQAHTRREVAGTKWAARLLTIILAHVNYFTKMHNMSSKRDESIHLIKTLSFRMSAVLLSGETIAKFLFGYTTDKITSPMYRVTEWFWMLVQFVAILHSFSKIINRIIVSSDRVISVWLENWFSRSREVDRMRWTTKQAFFGQFLQYLE